MMPSANTLSRSSAPPENRFSTVNRSVPEPASSIQMLTALYDTPGDGTVAPRRYTATMASVKRIFLRRSGVFSAEANAASNGPPGYTGVGGDEPVADDPVGRPDPPSFCDGREPCPDSPSSPCSAWPSMHVPALRVLCRSVQLLPLRPGVGQPGRSAHNGTHRT